MTEKPKRESEIAMEKFIVEIIHRETIKPSKPTPISLKNLKLSFLDQLAPMICVPVIFIYPNSAADHHFVKLKAEGRSQRLKKSLSETLTRFYPFAGRISSSSSSLIECNDEGVEFIETRVNCLLQDILKQPDLGALKRLLPMQMDPKAAAAKGDVFLVKLNFFQCGGMVIGINMSHKIADMSTFNLFINCWAAIARGSSDLVLPDFSTASSLFPPIADLPFPDSKMDDFKVQKVATRRLVFDGSKIAKLKAFAASSDVPRPTRVEAVAALIWKSAMAASTSNRGGFKRPSLLLQAANLRKTMNPPLSENSTGNLAIGFVARSTECETDQLNGLVKQLKSGIKGFKEDSVRKLQGSNGVSGILEISKEIGNHMSERDVDFYICSSWCGFDIYGADFGWGKPRWVSFCSAPPLNYINLMDSRDDKDGIEAWLTLSEAEMSVFECNKELLEFASVNPSIRLEQIPYPCKSTAPCRQFNSRM